MSAAGKSAPQEMQAFLQEQESLGYRHIRRGQIVEGEVVGMGREGLIVDVGSKMEGIVPPHEMRSLTPERLSSLKPGERVLVLILKADTQEEGILLSMDRAREEGGWRLLQTRLENSESLEAVVSGYNRGGLLVEVEGLQGFVPLSQMGGGKAEDSEEGLGSRVGQTVRLKVLELNRRRNRVILSERAALQEWRSQQRERLLEELREGEVRRGRITSVQDFGLFIDLGGADGLVPISELTWDRRRPLAEAFRVGQTVEVYVLKVDQESKKIALSLRRAQPQHWEQLVEGFELGQVVIGQVTKLVEFGAFARVEGALEGLIHISELSDRRLGHPKEVVREGELLPLKIIRIERERQRIGLSLKQARAEGESMGFVFNEAGGILEVPEEARQKLRASRQDGGEVNGEAAGPAGEASESEEGEVG